MGFRLTVSLYLRQLPATYLMTFATFMGIYSTTARPLAMFAGV